MLGTLLPEVASDWGLPAGARVIMGSPDTHSAAIGAGTVRNYDCHFYIGTSSWMVYHYPVKKTDFLLNQGAFPSAIPGRYIVMNSQQCGGACLQYLRDTVLYADDALSTGPKPEHAYDLLNQVAAEDPRRKRQVDLYALAVRRTHADRRQPRARRLLQPIVAHHPGRHGAVCL